VVHATVKALLTDAGLIGYYGRVTVQDGVITDATTRRVT